jgi:ribose 5-phosphate isomerase A
VTDNGNLILDLLFDGGIDDAERLGKDIKGTLGVVEHGLFVGMTDTCIVAGADGPRTIGGTVNRSS